MGIKKVKAVGEAAAREDQPAAAGGIRAKIAEFREFLELSKIEIKKVTWPTRKETVATSMAVLALVVVMAIFLGLVDLGLSKLVQHILS